MPTNRIVEVLWADVPPRRPAPDVATLVSRLRATLGPAVIRTGHDGYRLGTPPEVRVDLDEVARLIREGEQRVGVDAVLAAAAAARALEILGTGPALTGEPDDDWVRDVRNAVVADRTWELRDNVSAYDGCYVALAELLAADLATLDRRLSRAPGPLCRFLLP